MTFRQLPEVLKEMGIEPGSSATAHDAMMIRLGALLREPVDGPDGEKYLPLIDSSGVVKYQKVEARDPDPARIVAAPQFDNAESFASYVNKYKNLNDHASVLFAAASDRFIVAALDYHAPDKPSRREHNPSFRPKLDPIFDQWKTINGKELQQRAFAKFIEEHAGEVIQPDGASLLELASDLNLHVDVKYASKANLQNNLVQISYTEEVNNGGAKSGTIPFPTKMRVRMPIFFGEPAAEFDVFIRFNFTRGEPLAFVLDIHRIEYLLQEQFLLIVGRIGQATQLEPMFGKMGT
jgi:uncharacterized protein YfdQ (DUF2303 family)